MSEKMPTRREQFLGGLSLIAVSLAPQSWRERFHRKFREQVHAKVRDELRRRA